MEELGTKDSPLDHVGQRLGNSLRFRIKPDLEPKEINDRILSRENPDDLVKRVGSRQVEDFQVMTKEERTIEIKIQYIEKIYKNDSKITPKFSFIIIYVRKLDGRNYLRKICKCDCLLDTVIITNRFKRDTLSPLVFLLFRETCRQTKNVSHPRT